MKKQTAAVMSAVTLISSVNVPIVPAFAMGNQDGIEEVIEQSVEEQVMGPIAEGEYQGGDELVQADEVVKEEQGVTENSALKDDEVLIEEGEIKEDGILENTTEEVNQEVSSNESSEGSEYEPINEVITEEIMQEESVEIAGQTETSIQNENVAENTEDNQLAMTDAQEEVIDIPDKVLKAAINEALGRNTDLSHSITKSELEGLTELSSWGSEDLKINDLTGLEYAINLIQLDFSSNQIRDLSSLANLKKLTSLQLFGNQVTDLSPLANLKKLTSLQLSGNQITDFSPVNHVNDIDASDQVVYLETQQIKQGEQVIINNPVSGQIFGESASITIPTGVYNTEKNQLIWESVTTHHLQFSFSFKNNDFREVSGVVIIPVKFIDSEIEEEIIDIPDTTLRAEINKKLGRHNDPNHPITKGEMEQISELELHDYTGESTIGDLNGLEYAVNLKSLYISSYQVNDLTPLANLTNLIELSLSGCEISDLTSLKGLTSLTSLKSLDLGWNGLIDLTPLEGLTNLTSLDLYCNQIIDLTPLEGLTNLTSLSLGYNPISDLTSLVKLTNLTHLYLERNPISDLGPLLNLVNLKCFSLVGTQISDLTPLSNLTELEELYLGNLGIGGNRISDITPLSNLTKLNYLSLGCNQISDISIISNLINLKDLQLNGNHIKDLTPLDTLQSLEHLSVYLQEITLDPIYIQHGETVVIDNPLVGEWWKMENEFSGTIIYDVGFQMENGNYDADKNQFVWENVTTNSLSFSFDNSQSSTTRQYQGGTNGTVTIPVIFYEVSDNFTDFATNQAFNIIGGIGKLDDPLVLQIVEGTEVGTIKALLAKYSDYDLTVAKKVIKAKATSEFESYILTFTKGEEKSIFEVRVPSTETEMISYLNGLIKPTQKPTDPEQKPEDSQKPTGPEQKPADQGQKPENQQQPEQLTDKPQTGFSGLMGMLGLGAVSVGISSIKRKKK